MPTYEYICRACGHEFEEFHSITAAPIAVCPKCRKKKVERKISGGGAVIFKGGGFYETDYRSDSYRSGADADKKASEGSPEGSLGGSHGGKSGDASGGKSEGKTGGKSERKSDGKADGSATAGKSDARTPAPTDSASSSKPAADSSSDSSSGTTAKSSAADAENRRIESRATHASRIGRGVGNIVQAGASKGVAKGGASSQARPSKSSAPAPKKKR